MSKAKTKPAALNKKPTQNNMLYAYYSVGLRLTGGLEVRTFIARLVAAFERALLRLSFIIAHTSKK